MKTIATSEGKNLQASRYPQQRKDDDKSTAKRVRTGAALEWYAFVIRNEAF